MFALVVSMSRNSTGLNETSVLSVRYKKHCEEPGFYETVTPTSSEGTAP